MSIEMDRLAVSGNWRWPHGRVPLLVTNHGPHLYGTATSSGGRVIYAVLTDVDDAPAAARRTENGVTVMMIGFGAWLNQCASGSPRALEAMFCPDPLLSEVDSLRLGYKADNLSVYDRAIDLLCYSEDPKVRLDALRLAWNLFELRLERRFEPRLHPLQVEQYRRVVSRHEGDELLDIVRAVSG